MLEQSGGSPASVAVSRHHHDFFAGHEVTQRHQLAGPIAERVPGFYVHEIAPGPRYDGWVYASIGIWDAMHEQDGHGLEFVMTASSAQHRLVELVAMTAYYHSGPPSQRLDVGHTVPVGEPWLPGSSCEHLLLSVPYPFGPQLESCTWDGGHARLLWLLPITEAERAYKVAAGLEALEGRFDEVGIIPTNTARASVV